MNIEKSIFESPENPSNLKKEKTDFEKELDDFIQARNREQKERSEASLSISIDRVKLQEVINKGKFDEDERELMERMLRLPEKLEFPKGIVLIRGKNGRGKSTLAKAIYLSMAIKHKAEQTRLGIASNSEKNFSVHKNDSEDIERFKNAETEAQDAILNPNYGKDIEFITSAGLASELCKAVKLEDAFSRSFIKYVDVSTLGSEFKDERADMMGGSYTFGGGVKEMRKAGAELAKVHGSTRQQIDWALPHRLHSLAGKPEDPNDPGRTKESVFFIDEFEKGIDGDRHLQILEEINVLVEGEKKPQQPKSIAIMPSNSPILPFSNLPQINIDFPERGIHKPSEYDDEREILGKFIERAKEALEEPSS